MPTSDFVRLVSNAWDPIFRKVALLRLVDTTFLAAAPSCKNILKGALCMIAESIPSYPTRNTVYTFSFSSSLPPS